ncbi:MAG: cyclic nucleotide-binding domain-containing protein [Gammaproteobacteria bacterium]|nr:cyclic nucleotide-binding domain-containing protein [Gammaproteobacteria bacterium]MCW5584381.1 cyclic nucleotide-binding domain-containing protein [Gammaproteobacteria bacterium]
MSNFNTIDILKSFSLFSHLEDNDLIEISNALEFEQIAKGNNIVNEGDDGDKIYFILDGNAEAYIINQHGQEIILSSLNKGSYFGELALLTPGGKRNASVRAKTNCKLASLSYEKFNSIIATHPYIKDDLIKLLCKHLGKTLHVITEKEKNIIVVMICPDESTYNIQQFEQYFNKISQKSVVILNGNIPQNELAKKIDSIHNSYILVKVRKKPFPFLTDKANYIVNFIETIDDGFSLTPNVSLWKIQNTVRRITKKTIGIALCSGGVPAFAHIGVLNTLKKENIPLDYIVGTSAGAFIGGCFAFHGSTEKLINGYINFFKEKPKIKLFIEMCTHLSFNFRGIFKNTFLTPLLITLVGDKNIEEATIPFAAIASDLFTGNTVVLEKGSVINSINISNAAAVFSEPVKVDNQLLIDGVATAPLPVKVLVDKEIDIKIAVPIPQLDLIVPIKPNSKLLAIYMRSRSMMAEQIMNECALLADVIIRPEVSGIYMDDSTKFDSVIQAGEDAARLAIKRIKYLLNHE